MKKTKIPTSTMTKAKIPNRDYAEIGRRLIELRTSRNLSQRQAVDALQIKARTYQNYEYGLSKPNPTNLKKIIGFYGCTYGWLLAGEGEAFLDAPGEMPKAAPVSPDFPPDEFVFIRHVRGRISAGGGLIADNLSDFTCAFRKDWIKKKGGNPDQMSLIKVDGDSMAPTIIPGDLVLVNHAKKTVASQGGIYAISINQEIMIKRVQPLHPEGRLRIISDNKRYDPFEIEADKVRVNGKVIWFAREMER